MKSRMLTFFSIFLTLLLITWFYEVERLSSSLFSAVLLSLPFVVSITISLFFRERLSRHPSTWAQAILLMNFFSMGWISFCFSTCALRDLGGLLWLAFRQQDADLIFSQTSNQIVLLVALLSLIIATLRGWRHPKSRLQSIPLRNLPRALTGLKIVQITDLHIGPAIRQNYVRSVVETANELQPDLIVLTGDIVDGNSANLRPVADELKALHARLGVFYVPGNHEYYSDFAAWFEIFKSYGFILLFNEGQMLTYQGTQFWIGGTVDPMAFPLKPDVKASLKHSEAASFRILLSHQPSSTAHSAAELGYDLQISGHTHGGQYFPWNFVVRLMQKYPLGLMAEKNLAIYVGPGTGSWGAPLRLGTTTEVGELILQPTLVP